MYYFFGGACPTDEARPCRAVYEDFNRKMDKLLRDD